MTLTTPDQITCSMLAFLGLILCCASVPGAELSQQRGDFQLVFGDDAKRGFDRHRVGAAEV